MRITASVKSSRGSHSVVVSTSGREQTLQIPGKENGEGSAVNGGELLMLALATGYCNDLYREAERLNLRLDAVEVEACAVFAAQGLAASEVTYRARVQSSASREQIAQLLRETDAVAEVHNTLRKGAGVTLVE